METKICLYIEKAKNPRQNFLCIAKSKVLQKRGRKGEEIFTKKERKVIQKEPKKNTKRT